MVRPKEIYFDCKPLRITIFSIITKNPLIISTGLHKIPLNFWKDSAQVFPAYAAPVSGSLPAAARQTAEACSQGSR